jgi:hypothetical protein
MNALTLVEQSLKSLATAINAAHIEAQALSSQAIERAHDAGIRLIQAKAQVEHGQWLPWLSKNCPALAERTARAYMQLARDWKTLESQNGNAVADLPFRQAIKLLAAPKPANLTKKRQTATPAKYATPVAVLPKPEPSRPVSKPGALEAAIVPVSNPVRLDPMAAFDAAMNAPRQPTLDLGFLDMPDMQQLDMRFEESLDRAFPEPEHVYFQQILRPIEEIRDFMPKDLRTTEQARAAVDLLEILTQQARLRLAWLESHPEPQVNQEAQL